MRTLLRCDSHWCDSRFRESCCFCRHIPFSKSRSADEVRLLPSAERNSFECADFLPEDLNSHETTYQANGGRYAEIADMVDSVFPPLALDGEPTQEEFSSFNFWCAAACWHDSVRRGDLCTSHMRRQGEQHDNRTDLQSSFQRTSSL